MVNTAWRLRPEVDPELERYFDAPEEHGHLSARKAASGQWWFGARVRPGLTDEQIAGFTQWATTAALQLVDSDNPAANGWHPSTLAPGYWFMIGVEQDQDDLPPDPFNEATQP